MRRYLTRNNIKTRWIKTRWNTTPGKTTPGTNQPGQTGFLKSAPSAQCAAPGSGIYYTLPTPTLLLCILLLAGLSSSLLAIAAPDAVTEPMIKTDLLKNGPGTNNKDLGTTTEFLPVEQAFQLAAMPTAGGVTLIWTIAPDYYLYKHRFKITHADKDITSTAWFGEGTKKTDDYFGKVEVYFYQAIAEIPLPEPCTAGLDNCDRELLVQYQGCAEAGLCYPIQQTAIKLDGGAQ